MHFIDVHTLSLSVLYCTLLVLQFDQDRSFFVLAFPLQHSATTKNRHFKGHVAT